MQSAHPHDNAAWSAVRCQALSTVNHSDGVADGEECLTPWTRCTPVFRHALSDFRWRCPAKCAQLTASTGASFVIVPLPLPVGVLCSRWA